MELPFPPSPSPSPPLCHSGCTAQAEGHLSRVSTKHQLPFPLCPWTADAVSWEFPLPSWSPSRRHTGLCDSEAQAEPTQVFMALLLAGAALWLERSELHCTGEVRGRPGGAARNQHPLLPMLAAPGHTQGHLGPSALSLQAGTEANGLNPKPGRARSLAGARDVGRPYYEMPADPQG